MVYSVLDRSCFQATVVCFSLCLLLGVLLGKSKVSLALLVQGLVVVLKQEFNP